MPTAGYHSSDNGAIHLHLLRALGLKSEKPCKYQWDHLGSDRDHMDEYYAFVTCTRLPGEREERISSHFGSKPLWLKALAASSTQTASSGDLGTMRKVRARCAFQTSQPFFCYRIYFSAGTSLLTKTHTHYLSGIFPNAQQIP